MSYYEHKAISRSGLRACWNDAELFRKRQLGQVPPVATTAEMAFGSALDFYLTNGTIDPLDGYFVGEYDDFRTKAAREWRDALVAEGVDRDKILSKSAERQLRAESEQQMQALITCEEQIRNTPLANELIFGSPERSIVQCELYGEIRGTEVKSMPDRVIPGCAIVDLKTSSDVSVKHFQSQAHKFWYDVQAALAQQLWMMDNIETLPFIFVCVKSSEPYNVEVYEAGETMLEHGAQRFVDSLAWYQRCVETDVWKSRTHNERVCVEAPTWWKRERERELV